MEQVTYSLPYAGNSWRNGNIRGCVGPSFLIMRRGRPNQLPHPLVIVHHLDQAVSPSPTSQCSLRASSSHAAS
jgi:hypothetical protein